MEIFESHGFILNRLSNSASTLLENRLRSLYDITLSQWAVISILGEKEGISSSEIQKIVHIKVSSASGILSRMEKKELLLRVENPKDKREVNLYLSEKAKKLRPDIIKTVKEFNRECLAGFSKEEKELFRNMIDRAFENVCKLN